MEGKSHGSNQLEELGMWRHSKSATERWAVRPGGGISQS